MSREIKKHVFIGMSGGIDSCASVKILLDEGYKVTGITFIGSGEKNQTGKSIFTKKSSRKCCSTEEVIVAKNVCYSLGINHITLDLSEHFRTYVRDPFAQSYLKGETPNPCILCNRYVKIGALVDFALNNGADFIAMGHYTGLEYIDGEYLLKAGKDALKDQSYFLALLKPDILPYLIFPLAEKEKSEIQKIINDAGLPIQSNKMESQDICFIEKDYRDYLKEEGIPETAGAIVFDKKNVGTHNGIAFYALGQRKKLGVSLGKRIFVRTIDPERNTIILGDKPKSQVFRVSELNIFSKKFQEGKWEIQIRYRSPKILGSFRFIDEKTIEVSLSEPQDIVSPGQYAVFYKNNLIYGAGKIKDTDLL